MHILKPDKIKQPVEKKYKVCPIEGIPPVRPLKSKTFRLYDDISGTFCPGFS